MKEKRMKVRRFEDVGKSGATREGENKAKPTVWAKQILQIHHEENFLCRLAKPCKRAKPIIFFAKQLNLIGLSAPTVVVIACTLSVGIVLSL